MKTINLPRASSLFDRVRRRQKALLIATGVFLAGAILWRSHDILLGENFGTIMPGKAYRSAQLTGAGLREKVQKLNLRSVINLRGEKPHEDWYQDEIATCQSTHVRHYDIPLSAVRLPSPTAVRVLSEVLRTAPAPILIHCKKGADRTGLATAIWLIMSGGNDPEKAAANGLTLWHGHLPLGPTTAMDRFLSLYAQTGKGMTFEEWTRDQYPTVYALQVRPNLVHVNSATSR